MTGIRLAVGFAVACMLGTVMCAPAATMILEDDFEGYAPGDLLGQVAPNGQTWYDPDGLQPWNDSTLLDVSTAYATGTGQGAGRTDTDTAHGARLYLPLGETISNEVVVLECDIYSQGNYDYGWNLVTLFDSVNSRWLEVGFSTANMGSKHVYYEPYDNKLNTADIFSKRQATGGFNTIHIIQTFDLAAKSVTLEWYNVLTPANSGSWTATYANDFAPDLVKLTLKADSGGADKGFDNLSVHRPLPPPLMILDDDFEGYTTGDLLGQEAPNGRFWYDPDGLQAWNDSTLCDVATAYATGTGQGAGRTDADLNHGARLYLPLGETISNEVVVLECDIYSFGNFDDGWNLVTLFDSVNSRWLEVGFGSANIGSKHIYYEWNDNKLGIADLASKRQPCRVSRRAELTFHSGVMLS